MDSDLQQKYLDSCCTIAQEAGRLIMQYFAGPFATRRKDDDSPVTDADIAANNLITKALIELTPDIPVIAEEDDVPGREDHELFWLVDPLDGTRSFVRGEPEFTVNIGLIFNRTPLLGVIYGPPQEALYWASVEGKAYRSVKGGKAEVISARKPAAEGLVVTRSKSHPSKATTDYLDRLKIKDIVSGSSSMKFCQVAEGSADIYPRFGRTMEWDSAAGHAILLAAGGRVETTDGKPLMYGKPGLENPGFIAYGK